MRTRCDCDRCIHVQVLNDMPANARRLRRNVQRTVPQLTGAGPSAPVDGAADAAVEDVPPPPEPAPIVRKRPRSPSQETPGDKNLGAFSFERRGTDRERLLQGVYILANGRTDVVVTVPRMKKDAGVGDILARSGQNALGELAKKRGWLSNPFPGSGEWFLTTFGKNRVEEWLAARAQ